MYGICLSLCSCSTDPSVSESVRMKPLSPTPFPGPLCGLPRTDVSLITSLEDPWGYWERLLLRDRMICFLLESCCTGFTQWTFSSCCLWKSLFLRMKQSNSEWWRNTRKTAAGGKASLFHCSWKTSISLKKNQGISYFGVPPVWACCLGSALPWVWHAEPHMLPHLDTKTVLSLSLNTCFSAASLPWWDMWLMLRFL